MKSRNYNCHLLIEIELHTEIIPGLGGAWETAMDMGLDREGGLGSGKEPRQMPETGSKQGGICKEGGVVDTISDFNRAKLKII